MCNAPTNFSPADQRIPMPIGYPRYGYNSQPPIQIIQPILNKPTKTGQQHAAVPAVAEVIQFKHPIVVHEHDILSGRGVFISHHPGNQRFRTLVKTFTDATYCSDYSASEKRAVAKEIIGHIDALTPPGRFLKRDGFKKWGTRGIDGPWKVMSREDSIKRVCQALRDCNRQDRSGYASRVIVPVDVALKAEEKQKTGLTGKEWASKAATESAYSENAAGYQESSQNSIMTNCQMLLSVGGRRYALPPYASTSPQIATLLPMTTTPSIHSCNPPSSIQSQIQNPLNTTGGGATFIQPQDSDIKNAAPQLQGFFPYANMSNFASVQPSTSVMQQYPANQTTANLAPSMLLQNPGLPSPVTAPIPVQATRTSPMNPCNTNKFYPIDHDSADESNSICAITPSSTSTSFRLDPSDVSSFYNGTETGGDIFSSSE